MTGTLRARATCPTGVTVSANSGPRMISAPSSSACCAACCAPGARPPSSLIRSWRSGLLNSASAISAALRMDCAATPAFPLPDSGKMRPTFTWPVPMLLVGCDGGVGEEFGNRSPSEKLPEQPASSTAHPAKMSDRQARERGEACNTRNISAGLLYGSPRCHRQSAPATGILPAKA